MTVVGIGASEVQTVKETKASGGRRRLDFVTVRFVKRFAWFPARRAIWEHQPAGMITS
jgi:hypothetical protein